MFEVAASPVVFDRYLEKLIRAGSRQRGGPLPPKGPRMLQEGEEQVPSSVRGCLRETEGSGRPGGRTPKL